jgi:hypothetical protein
MQCLRQVYTQYNKKHSPQEGSIVNSRKVAYINCRYNEDQSPEDRSKANFLVQAVSRRPLTAAAWVRAQVNPVVFVVDKVALGQVLLGVLRFYPVNIVPP